jgi:hypothetical protein
MLVHHNPMRARKMVKLVTLADPPTSLNDGLGTCYIEPACLPDSARIRDGLNAA